MCELELKAEKEKALLAAELEAAACEHELKMASLGKHAPSDKASTFDPARNIRLVPPFQEKEVEKDRWCHSKEIGKDFKKLKQMVLLEEFKDKVRPDIRSHLDEQKVEELEKAAIMADDYALTHKMSSRSGNPQQKRYHGSGN